jgi:hypothetical protein
MDDVAHAFEKASTPSVRFRDLNLPGPQIDHKQHKIAGRPPNIRTSTEKKSIAAMTPK